MRCRTPDRKRSTFRTGKPGLCQSVGKGNRHRFALSESACSPVCGRAVWMRTIRRRYTPRPTCSGGAANSCRDPDECRPCKDHDGFVGKPRGKRAHTMNRNRARILLAVRRVGRCRQRRGAKQHAEIQNRTDISTHAVAFRQPCGLPTIAVEMIRDRSSYKRCARNKSAHRSVWCGSNVTIKKRVAQADALLTHDR